MYNLLANISSVLVFFSPSVVNITSPSYRLHFSTSLSQYFPLFHTQSHLISSASRRSPQPPVHLHMLHLGPGPRGGSPSPLSASLLNSCHENQTDTLNWCSRLKETGLKYLHNFTEDGRKLLKHVSRARPWPL